MAKLTDSVKLRRKGERLTRIADKHEGALFKLEPKYQALRMKLRPLLKEFKRVERARNTARHGVDYYRREARHTLRRAIDCLKEEVRERDRVAAQKLDAAVEKTEGELLKSLVDPTPGQVLSAPVPSVERMNEY